MATVTRGAFAKRLCNARNLNATQRRLNALVSWETAEGTMARFNPLATTRDMEGDSLYNTTGVRNYPDLKTGIKATWLTLDEPGHGYEGIVKGLEDNTTARAILEAVAASAWGTGWLALQVLPFVKEHFENYASKPIGQ